MVNMGVKIGKMSLKNPVMAASGTWGGEYMELSDISKLGAVVLKTVTLDKRIGNKPPRVFETAAGMLNAIGLENKGVDDLIANKVSLFKDKGVRVVVSIAGNTLKEFKELALKLSDCDGIEAIEINLSCPNIVHGLSSGLIAHDEKATYKAVKMVRDNTHLTVITKLSPNVTDIGLIAKAAEAAGADAVAAVNTFIGMAVNIKNFRPRLGNVTGGLSGPAIKPLALRSVWQIRQAVTIPIIGIGGIMDYKDALEFMLCGASAIQAGTANFIDPRAAEHIVSDLEQWACNNKVKRLKDIVGAIKFD